MSILMPHTGNSKDHSTTGGTAKMDRLGRSVTSVTASDQHLTASTSLSTERMKLAKYHARLILGCYRGDAASDPEVYTTAVVAVLAAYPEDIGARLSNPKDGIAGRYKWLPTVS